MSAFLQLNPNLHPSLAHTKNSIVLCEGDLLLGTFGRHQTVSFQNFAQLLIFPPYDGSHGNVVEGSNGNDFGGDSLNCNGFPLARSGFFHGLIRDLGLRLSGFGEGDGP